MLTLRSIPVRNLFHHWRGNLALLLGVAVGASVLTGALFVGDQLVPFEDLPARLAAIAEKGGAKPPQVYLRADRGLDYGAVMRVMGELNRAGLNRVSLITDASAKP